MYNKLVDHLEEDFNSMGEVKKTRKKGLNESMLNEGEFSWLLPDGEPIYSTEGHQKTVYMLDDKRNKWQEDAYEGYGEFGGKDFYELVAEMNGVTEAPEGKDLRDIGIDLCFPDSPNGTGDNAPGIKYPKLTDDPNATYDQLPNPETDPNQGWYQESELDWEEDEDESVKEDQGEIIDIPDDTDTPVREEEAKGVSAEELHNWYLEGSKELDPENFNEEAQVPYESLPEPQRKMDQFIADKINQKLGNV